jgi:hypothetical protein
VLCSRAVPVLVALPFGVSLGVGFAWAARRELRRVTSRETSRGLAVAALFAVCVFAPVGAYFLAFEPDWCLAYLLDTARSSAALVPALVLLEVVSVPLGFLLGGALLRRGDETNLLRLLGTGAVVTLASVMLGLRRFAVQGSYAQFHGDFGTQPLAGSSLGYAVLLLGFWLAAGFGFALWNLQRID